MNDDEVTVPCSTCGTQTRHCSTQRCDNCWEVETRLATYLNKGGANARRVVEESLRKSREERMTIECRLDTRTQPSSASPAFFLVRGARVDADTVRIGHTNLKVRRQRSMLPVDERWVFEDAVIIHEGDVFRFEAVVTSPVVDVTLDPTIIWSIAMARP